MSAAAHLMRGKVCLVTGASSGIGLVTAEALARQGATTILVARDPGRGAAAVERIRQATGNSRVEVLLADLSAPAVYPRTFYTDVNVLCCNGIASTRSMPVTPGYPL
jgi:NAD(P)-dependent dehydrogenase (short-subunit alcohol dehydrogenase family)